MAISSQKPRKQTQTSTAITIRLFGTRDYEAVVAVHNAVYPDRPSTAEEWRYDDEHFDKQYVNERHVAERPETEDALRAREAISVKTQVWEAMPEGLAFAVRAGFQEVMRAWESRLDVAGFDVPAFRPALDRALAGGMEITMLAAEREKDRDNLRRLHAMEVEIAEDVPRPPDDVHTPVPFDMWMEHVVDAPWGHPRRVLHRGPGRRVRGHLQPLPPAGW